jgi:hypothetical protein
MTLEEIEADCKRLFAILTVRGENVAPFLALFRWHADDAERQLRLLLRKAILAKPEDWAQFQAQQGRIDALNKVWNHLLELATPAPPRPVPPAAE